MRCASLSHVLQLIKQSNNIIVTAHINPDGDSLGSMLALYSYIKSCGKKLQMLLDDDIPDYLKFLPNIDSISKPLKNLNADLVIVLDASDMERIGAVRSVAASAPILNIDHHKSNTEFADYLYLDARAAATGEIIYNLLKEAGTVLSIEQGICLYTAIATDCGFFRYANTTAATLRIAADLIELGVEPQIVSENIETRSRDSLLMLTKVLDTLEFFNEGKIASISINQMDDPKMETEGFINYPRAIEGVEVAIMFKKTDTDIVRVSMRSKKVDVSKIALNFGGGGHARAAGCTVFGSFEEVKEKVIASLTDSIKEVQH